MRRNNIFKGFLGGLLIAMLTPLNTLILTSCSDEPDSEYFYTFTGEMMSDYLRTRPDYSEFAEIVERAGLMSLLASYGHYTCFAPSNDAIDKYLRERGLNSVSQLSDADCDTIARTHLVSSMYTTYEMIGHKLPTVNMMNRYLGTEPGFDKDSNAVIVLEGLARIDFNLKDDSVENGIMQPIDMVIEKSNSYIADILRDNPKISLFYKALVATGIVNDVMLVEDENYNPRDYEAYYMTSGDAESNKRRYDAPDTKKFGYTFFIEPDSLLEAKYGIKDLKGLYDKACEIYDEVYPQDISATGHSFENLTDSVNPLRRFIQYHILNKIAASTDDLTPQEISNKTNFIGAIGIDENLVNPCDWHYTLLPHTMIKVDKITVNNNKRVWWVCNTCNHHWKVGVGHRNKGRGCPKCADKQRTLSKHKRIIALKGSFTDNYPHLLKEWDYNGNSGLDPKMLPPHCGKKVLWICSTCGHSWQATMDARATGSGCPKCADKQRTLSQRKKIVELKGAFADTHPHLIKDWDYSKNEGTPNDYSAGSSYRANWKCHHCGYEWEVSIYKRTKGHKCPKCHK